MKISQRVQETISSPLRKFLPLAELAEKQGVKVYYLNIGQPDLETPEVILEKIRSFSKKTVAYAPSNGFLKSREAWAKYYFNQNIKINAQNLIITTGASEAMLYALLVMMDWGEEMIVFEPFYSNYKALSKITGIKLAPVLTRIEDNFSLPDNKRIIEKINKKTKAILVCNPNNPTGTVYPKRDLERIVKIAKKYKLWILADETYREIVFGKSKAFSLMNFPLVRNQVILVDSISKRFSACGLRVGCIASYNKEIIDNVLKLTQSRLAAPTIEQLAVISFLKNSKEYTKKLTQEYFKRTQLVFNALKKISGAVPCRPQGAFYIIVKLPIDNSEKFISWMLSKFRVDNETIMISPAKDFYQTKGLGEKEVRISCVLSKDKLERAMRILTEGIKKYNRYNRL